MSRYPTLLSLLVALAGLGACAVVPPSGPMVLATPPGGKDLDRFRQEDASCRDYAQAQLGGSTPGQAATQSAVGSAAIGTALGAAAGALIGSASAAAGSGAAIGAGTGLLLGSALGTGNAQASGAGMQRAYDTAYAQCMTSQGNTVQAGLPGLALPYEPYAVPYAGHAYPYAGPTMSLGFGYGYGYGYRPWRHRPYGWRHWGHYGYRW